MGSDAGTATKRESDAKDHGTELFLYRTWKAEPGKLQGRWNRLLLNWRRMEIRTYI